MRLCTFILLGEDAGSGRIGVVDGGRVFEVEEWQDVMQFLQTGNRAESLVRRGDGAALGEVRLLPPIPRPGKIVAAIVNTKGMLGGDLTLEWPRLDTKAPSSVVGPGDDVRAPESGVRPEVELAAVLGQRVSGATPSEAKEGIFGYTILNDITCPQDSREDAYEAFRRDKKTGEIRRATLRGPLFRSKNHDTFCPMGPWVVTGDELGDTGSLKMTTKFGSLSVQAGSTSEYIFAPEDIVSYVSGFLTLEPGDVVSCGSVGWTKEALGERDPTEFVLPSAKGELELEIERIGELRNPVVPASGRARASIK